MPQIRKLSPEELQVIEERERQGNLASQLFGPLDAPPRRLRDDKLLLEVAAHVGDLVQLVQLDHSFSGVVLRYEGNANEWDCVQLLIDGQRRWFTSGTIVKIIGRPRGISRIDHPARRTHGWYVRLYDRGVPKVARLFSDGQYNSKSDALEAALAFHANAEQSYQQA